MRAKSWVLLLIALGCGLVASVGISQVVIEGRGSQQKVQTVEILVAVKDIPHMTQISAETIRLEEWPKDRVPEGAIRDISLIEGKYTNQRLFQGEPILERKLNNDKNSIKVPPGYRIFDLKVDDESGAVGYIKPGDHVDVYGFFEKSKGAPVTASKKVMEDVEVYMVDGVTIRDDSTDGPSSRSNVFQLLIKDSQYSALNTAMNMGKLKCSLRNPGDKDKTLSSDDGRAFEDWVNGGPPKVTTAPAENLRDELPVDMFSQQFSRMQTPAKPKKGMLIFTPDGLQEYEWSDDSKLPTLVEEQLETEASQSNELVSGVNAGNMIWNPTTGNWTSGGMQPQYPSDNTNGTDAKTTKTDSPDAPKTSVQ